VLLPTDGIATALVIWDSEAAARNANQGMGVIAGTVLGPGASVDSVEVIEVWSHA